jgi:diacylglycerol O-acyltransferase
LQQLTPLDAVFLSMETRETPGHIGGLSFLDPVDSGINFERFLEFISARVQLVDRFGWRVQEVPFGLDLPYWVKDRNFDIHKHISRAALPSPGSDIELAEVAGRLFEAPLRRDRPLWEMTWIEGLRGGRIGLLWKVHHAVMDGMSGAGLMEVLFDLEEKPTSRRLAKMDDHATGGSPVSGIDMAVRTLTNSVTRPVSLAKHAFRAGAAAVSGYRGEGRFATPSAPRTPFNSVVGAQRSIAWSSVSFDEVRTLKNVLGVKLNDVALAITGGALRNYLLQQGALPEESLIASVPVSTRKRGDKSIGNQVSEVGMYWGTDVEDPVERVRAIHEKSTEAKRNAELDGINLLAALGESFSPNVVGIVSQLASVNSDSIPLPGNAVLSNVPLPPIPLFLDGAHVEKILPISILAPTQGLNITVLTYAGELHFGLTFDPELVPEPWLLAEGISKALIELQSASKIVSQIQQGVAEE